FLILSSAKFEAERIDVDQRIGLELLLPLASVLPFERHVRWAQTTEVPRKVAEQLLGKAAAVGAPAVALTMLGTKVLRLPGPVGVVATILSTALSKEDRKSTRLNSSHVSISYAVFCLKKQREVVRI